MVKTEFLSVCVPVYNGAETIQETLRSVLSQDSVGFEVVVVDNASTDSTVRAVQEIKDERIRLYMNERNLGCGGNLDECFKRSRGEVIFFLCADDILRPQALLRVQDALARHPRVGLLVRPYYWFCDSPEIPVRLTRQFETEKEVVLSDSWEDARDVLALCDQISGLAFRRRDITGEFGREPFIEASTMALRVFRKKPAVVLNEMIVGIRISNNGSMNPAVYAKSPMERWRSVVEGVLGPEGSSELSRRLIRDWIGRNYIGLVQIRCYGRYRYLLREIGLLIRYNPSNLMRPIFWFFALGTMFMPAFILRPLVVFFKNKVFTLFLKRSLQ